ncbi:MAG: hypothetical protein ABI766_02280 [Gemmatimonadales bacterium]
MIKRRWFGATLLLLGCGGAAAGPGAVHPSTSPSAAVTGFLQAVSDSNLAAMASLWGSASGPSSRTRQPSDYERRIIIMQAYLRHDDSRILTDTPAANPTRHAIQAQLRRSACTWTVPFEVIQLSDSSWIVNSVDVAAAGNPARPCDPTTTDTSTSR